MNLPTLIAAVLTRNQAAASEPEYPTENLLLSYDPDTLTGGADSAVTLLSDLSGNGHDATATAGGILLKLAALNGHNVIAFDGSKSMGIAGVTTLADYTLVLDMRSRAAFRTVMGINGNYLLNDYSANAFGVNDSANAFAGGPQDNEWVNLIIIQTGGHVYAYISGELIRPYLGRSAVAQNFSTLGGFLENIYVYVGDLARLLLYTDAKNATVRRAIADVSDGRLSLGPRRGVTCEGDSITALGYPTGLQILLGNVTHTLFNTAVSGNKIPDLVARAATIDGLYAPRRPLNLLIVGIGSNCIADTSQSAAEIYAALTAYIAARRIAQPDGKIALLTVIARAGYTAAGKEPTRIAYNALIVANSAGVDAVIDIASDPHFDTEADTANLTYYEPDGIHPTQGPGNNLFRDAVAATMAANGW